MRVIDTNQITAPPPAVSVNELTLGEVAEIINQLKAVPSLEDVEAWFSALLLRQRDYDAYRLFSARKYARNLIARSAYAELLMLCWRTGQRTPMHDHGGSIGVVMVAEEGVVAVNTRREPKPVLIWLRMKPEAVAPIHPPVPMKFFICG